MVIGWSKVPARGLFKSGSSSDQRLDIDDGFFSLIAFDDLDLLRPCSCDLAREFISRALTRKQAIKFGLVFDSVDLIWEADKYPSSRHFRYDFSTVPLA